MEKRKLGASDLEVSVIGFGAWAAGKAGWGDANDRELEGAVRRAHELGVNFFDTAPVYGFGESERLIGRALKPIRDEVVIATKFGLVWNEQGLRNDLTAANARREVEESLRRLGIEAIDLYQVHWPDPTGETPIEETLGTLAELVREGKIKRIGVSNFSASQLEEALLVAPVVALQSPYNLLQRQVERSELPYAAERGVGFIAYSPLAQGLLTGKFGPGTRLPADDVRSQLNPLFQPEAFADALDRVDRLKRIAADYGKTPAQLALAWLLDQPGVTTAIAGAKTAAQAEENAGGAGWRLQSIDAERLGEIFAS
ncbi:aldo/keto reductase [Paenibacillaceae bacterium WGS1546]|uniref:aldo/keto reductase n=1 Tax=Cohnella sp. WGS1546 TaxID=3366810 RepID=UPI00372D3DC8